MLYLIYKTLADLTDPSLAKVGGRFNFMNWLNKHITGVCILSAAVIWGVILWLIF